MEVSNNTQVGYTEYGSILILVNCNNKFTFLHTSQMLNGTTNTTCKIEIGANSLTRLSNLTTLIHNSSIHHGTTARYLTTKNLGELLQFGESVFGSDTTAATHQYLGLADICDYLLFLYSFDNLYTIDFLFVKVNGIIYHLSFSIRIGSHFLHYTGTNHRKQDGSYGTREPRHH